MANRHELEIKIDSKGEIKVHVKGAKGKQCLQYVEIFKQIGEIKNTELTSEYYEPENPSKIVNPLKNFMK